MSGFDGDRCGHVMSWEAGCQIEPGRVGRFVLREDCAIVEFFDADDGGADASAGDFDLGSEVGGVGEAGWLGGGGGRGGRGCAHVLIVWLMRRGCRLRWCR